MEPEALGTSKVGPIFLSTPQSAGVCQAAGLSQRPRAKDSPEGQQALARGGPRQGAQAVASSPFPLSQQRPSCCFS